MKPDLPPYRVIVSDRKTLSLEITRDAEVLVRVPRRTSRRALEQFVAAHANWIEVHLQKQRERKAAVENLELTSERVAYLKAAARQILPGKLERYAALMDAHPTHLSVTGAERRFGSCSSTGRICFSWRLMLYPEEAVDYVVVHELAHLRHMNHSADFYACIARYLPDYKERKAMLRLPSAQIPDWVVRAVSEQESVPR